MNIKTYTDIYNIVEIEDVFYHSLVPNFFQKKDSKDNEKKYVCGLRVSTKLYTDGEIIEIHEEEPQNINEYFINGRKYDRSVDTLVKKQVHIKNARYILKVVVAEDVFHGQYFTGLFDIIKSTEIFLNDKKDKEALKNARKSIRSMSKSIDNCKSVLETFLPQKDITVSYERINNNVYKLIKEK